MHSDEIGQMVEGGSQPGDRWDFFRIICTGRKNIAGNFENVGYAKVDKAGIYNILIMEEKQTILASGAGAGLQRSFCRKEDVRPEQWKENESDPH